ncbi:hypothetical protein AAG589_15110 [Isoptericola sp. F-RaC21]|uniref:hypothetical protein n=1 Tax=Isoptericola sp. F-RaC21 TaxID=3141452 RepID=UPI00315C3949
MDRMNAWTRNFRLWAFPLLGPPTLAAALLVPIPPAAFVLWLTALTPGTLVLMSVQARKRRLHPQADAKTFLRIAVALSAVVLALVATFYALRHWGPVPGAIGAVASYGLMWIAARHVAAQMDARRRGQDAIAPATAAE